MSLNPLQQFARQLCTWATNEIQIKPGPFQTVDIPGNLLLATEPSTPPVVFWVNRESHLAGGVILLPRKDPTEVLESGREICSTLGLNYYYTWGVGELAAWRIDGSPARLWSEPLSQAENQGEHDVRQALSLMIENMQNRFIVNQPNLPIISAKYLTNQFHNVIETVLASIDTSAQDQEYVRDTLAGIIVQLLSLSSHKALPVHTSPENLITGLNNASGHLPVSLASALKKLHNPSWLPEKALIKIHHLYRRVQQYDPEISKFFPDVVSNLLRYWSEKNRAMPIPTPIKKHQATLIISPDRYYPEMDIVIEVATPSLIAATALLRQLQSSDRRHPEQYSDLMELRPPIKIDAVVGSLDQCAKATKSDQKRMNALLRHSWPNRHLNIDVSAPHWVWRAVHLFGLLRGSPYGTLNLPVDWLWEPYGQQFFALVSERVNICKITQTHSDRATIAFNQSDKKQITVKAMRGDSRTLDNQSLDISRTDLLLAFSLQADLYDLIRNGELSSGELNTNEEAVELYLRSTLGRGLWKILAPRKSLPGKTRLESELKKTGLPIPGIQVLNALAQLTRKHKQPDTATIDRELEVWLSSACLKEPIPCFNKSPEVKKTTEDNPCAEEIAANLNKSGAISSFPKDYLYSTPENKIKYYSISGPLTIEETFFNTVSLTSPEGGSMGVEGVATARALQIISTVQLGEVGLPVDEQQVEIILERYLRDLKNLQATIREANIDTGNSLSDTAIEQVWNLLPVPPMVILDQ